MAPFILPLTYRPFVAAYFLNIFYFISLRCVLQCLATEGTKHYSATIYCDSKWKCMITGQIGYRQAKELRQERIPSHASGVSAGWACVWQSVSKSSQPGNCGSYVPIFSKSSFSTFLEHFYEISLDPFEVWTENCMTKTSSTESSVPRMAQPSVCGRVSDCDARLGLNASAYPSASTSYVNWICICVHCGKKIWSHSP